MLRLQIEAERSRAKAAQVAHIAQMQMAVGFRSSTIVQREEVVAQPRDENPQEDIGGSKDNSRLAIFPCVRVDLDPPRKAVPLIVLPSEDKDHHAKSHRQMLATYTKRSNLSQ